MKKILLSLIAVMTSVLAMADTATFDWSKVGTTQNNVTTANTYTQDKITLTFNKGTGSNFPAENKEGSIRMYTNTELVIKAETGYVISKVVFTPTSETYNATKLTYNDTAISDEWTPASKTNEINLSATANARFKNIVVTYEEQTAITKQNPDLKWSTTSVSLKKGDTFTAPTFTKATTAKVTFTSSDDEVAAVSEDGVITLGDQLGTTTITATSEANDDYDKGTATCTITVYDVEEITCAKAAEIAQALTSNNVATTQIYKITGYITETNGTVSKNQQIFWMADTKDGGKVFEGYWANLPEPYEALSVGTKITMTGAILKYDTTSEMKNGTVVILEKSTEKIDTIVATAAEAYAVGKKLASNETTKEFYDITAYVDSITYKYSNGSESFLLVDAKGAAVSDTIIAYKAALSEAALQGAKVRIIGKITNYKGTVEIAQGGQCTILEQGVDAAIREIEAVKNDDNAIYNLSAQKVGRNYKGVVIKGGKKYIQK